MSSLHTSAGEQDIFIRQPLDGRSLNFDEPSGRPGRKEVNTQLSARVGCASPRVESLAPDGGKNSKTLPSIYWRTLERHNDSTNDLSAVRTAPSSPFAPQSQELKHHPMTQSFSFGTSWNQLTKFEGEARSLRHCLSILRQPALVECSLLLKAHNVDARSACAPCVHPGLEKLSLVVYHDSSLCLVPLLLPLLTLPALSSFQLDMYDTSLNNFLQRHCQTLRSLAVEYLSIHAINTLPHLPALTSLTMYSSREPNLTFTRNFFTLIGAPHARFLPALQHLKFHTFDSREPADFTFIARALVTRWNRRCVGDVAEFRSLYIEFGLADGERLDHFGHVLRPLREMKAGGVGIDVSIGSYFLPTCYTYDSD